MNLLVVFFIITIVLVGYGLTLLIDVDLAVEERALYGVLVGVMVVSTVGFFFSWWADMSRASIIAASIFSLGLSGPGWRRAPARNVAEWRDFVRRIRLPLRDASSPAPLIAVVLVSAVVSVRILDIAYGTTADGGISVGHLSTFGDWSAHLAYAASFAYADNFPPELPTAAGESFAYHFGVDFFAAMFIPLGTSLQRGLQLSAGILAVAFPGIIYVSTHRFFKNRLTSVLTVLIFLAAGGTAALYRFFFEDLPENGLGVLGDLPRSYAFDGFQRNWLDNPVTGFLYPQRPTMIGFAAVMMGLALLWQARGTGDKRTHLAVGLVTGIMPVFHVFGFGVLIVLGLWWAALECYAARRVVQECVWFAAPALVVGIPLVGWQWPSSGANGRNYRFWWVLGEDFVSWRDTLPDFIWFWFLNTGVFIPLVVVGLVRSPELTKRFAPIFGLLLIANVGIWHFWVGNNAKYVVFFLLLGAPFAASFLTEWIRNGWFYKLGAGLVVVSLTLSGGLDIWRAFEGSSGAYPAGYMTGDDVLLGEYARDRLEADAVFAVANNNVHPIRAIAGRTVVSGSTGRLSDLGVDWDVRAEDLRVIFGVNEGFEDVISKYEIDYIVLGPEERRAFRPVDAPADWDPAQFWDAAALTVYDIGGYKIYDVREFQS